MSDTLIENLELVRGYKTVPALADLIADACQATAAQRDELVLEKYRGTYRPRPVKLTPQPEKAAPAPVETLPPARERIPVVVIDREGNVVGEYPSMEEAAFDCGIDRGSVVSRVKGRVKNDEFAYLGVSFRNLEEWERMTPEERRESVVRTLGPGARAGRPMEGRISDDL